MTNISSAAQAIYDSFATTTYGQTLEKRARFERFRPAHLNVIDWEKLLGPNVNNLHHLYVTANLATTFVQDELNLDERSFSGEDQILLEVAGVMHDQAESITGDIPYGRKSSKERHVEHRILVEHEHEFTPHISKQNIDYYRLARDKIAFGDQHSRLAAAFNAIENVGHLETVLQAIKITQTVIPADIKIKLDWLVAESLGSKMLERIIHHSEQFPSLKTNLLQAAALINHGFDTMDVGIFAQYLSDADAVRAESSTRLQHFKLSRAMWHTWLITHA